MLLVIRKVGAVRGPNKAKRDSIANISISFLNKTLANYKAINVWAYFMNSFNIKIIANKYIFPESYF